MSLMSSITMLCWCLSSNSLKNLNTGWRKVSMSGTHTVIIKPWVTLHWGKTEDTEIMKACQHLSCKPIVTSQKRMSPPIKIDIAYHWTQHRGLSSSCAPPDGRFNGTLHDHFKRSVCCTHHAKVTNRKLSDRDRTLILTVGTESEVICKHTSSPILPYWIHCVYL